MSETVVRTEALTKRYGGTLALDRLDVELSAGQVLGFLGPNGAGKTTTLRLLMGSLRPSSGRAVVLGHDAWRERSAVHAAVGYLPGDVRLWPRLTGAQTLEYMRRLRGLTRPAGPVSDLDDVAKRLGVELDRPVGSLSKGNRQKVALLLALLGDPPLLLLDEPTGGLDPLGQQEFHRVVRERAEAGAAVLLSSHVLSEVERVADRVAVIRSGRLIMLESLEELRRTARHSVHVRFAQPPPPGAFDRVPGLTDVRQDGAQLRCTVQGEIDPFIKTLAGFQVVDLVSHEADLEETFLALYGHSDGDERR
ncbi:ABC transporter ATP-binding protein [Actinocrinis puniceicyclus]|uniref:ABC transporter ATP-binding protein n=1 Tax=Actinocrinis puniceicyclus TaxID=977794 RepID=A0A8J8BDR9_9ACTN|nr:ABC transporter ATP-binding protein [Actinocrinis puniceicyclus]MBS2966532.1 ABC transporter ATP-binding protein [Actinocrinis puniceicyclus]